MASREKTKVVTPKGLNHHNTMHTVDDGWCEVLNNMAFRGGQLTSVRQHTPLQEIDLEGHDIVYIHPILPDGDYITIKNSSLYHISTNGGAIDIEVELLNTEILLTIDNVRVSHFENYLFMQYERDGALISHTFIYDNQSYGASKSENIRELDSIDISYTYSTPRPLDLLEYAPKIATVTVARDINNIEYIKSFDKIYEGIYADMSESNFIHGAVYLIFALRMQDGSLVYNSKIYMLNSENGLDNSYGTLFKKHNTEDNNIIDYCKYIHGFKAQISFAKNRELIENPNVKSVVIYSTRNTPLYDLDNVHNSFPSDEALIERYDNGYIGTSSSCIFDKRAIDALSQPFYELGEVELHETTSILLSAKDYVDIETKTIFTPLISPHSYIPQGGISLNGRWHQYNITGKPYEPSLVTVEDEEIKIMHATFHRMASKNSDIIAIGGCVTLNIGGKEVRSYRLGAGHSYLKVESMTENSANYIDNPAVIVPNLISYPDVRATKYELFITRYNQTSDEVETILLKSYNLEPVIGNNYAVYRNSNLDALNSYEVIYVRGIENNNYQLPTESEDFYLPNMLMVSDYGLPHIFQPRHIYYIGNSGESEILNIDLPLDQLTESAFGQYPLYIFTSTGIYAMQQGSDNILYQSIIQINNDVIDGKSNSVSLDGALHYISRGGVRALRGYESGDISEIIKTEAYDFFLNAKLYSKPYENELLVINSNYNYAYIYSTLSKMWSTRDFGGRMITDSVYHEGHTLFILREEGNSSYLSSLVRSRIMKLDERNHKRLHKLQVLITASGGYDIKLYGSNDALEWCELATTSSCDTIGRRNSSWLWYKYEVEGRGIILDGAIFDYVVKY